MARAFLQSLPSVLKQVGPQIAESLPDGLSVVAMGEVFDLRFLESLTPGIANIRLAIRPRLVSPPVFGQVGQRIHVQLRDAGGGAVGFARAVLDKDGATWTVYQTSKSPVAARIAAAIADVDALVPDDTYTYLLYVPEYRVTAFLFDDSAASPRLYVIDRPDGLDPIDAAGKLTDARRFLTVLTGKDPILGMRR